MATINHMLDNHQEQICYVQCSFCNTILLVSVPCSSMTMVVTVRCGHCNGLLSVNMLKASFVPLHLLSAFNQPDQLKQEDANATKTMMERQKTTTSMVTSFRDDPPNNQIAYEDDDDDDDISIDLEQFVNKPPEKKRRPPSAYNHFIKEEIRRLKARNPHMSHKEAFSAASKNWALFPSVRHNDNEENCEKESATQNL